MIMLFFAVYYYGYGVSMSVASEKTSRVMETLLTSTKPSKIILGKSAAMGLLGLLQLAIIILTGAVTYKVFFPKDFMVFGQSVDLSSFTPYVIFMVFTYFILGYTLYAMMNAVVGATVSKAEDINSAIMPISFVSIISFYLAYGTIFLPNGAVAVAASIIPFSSAFSMPCRLIIADVPTWQVAASLFAMIIAIVLMSWISIKIYSSAVLHYGRRLRMKDLIRMSKGQSSKGM
jgi:ABC-2 type transport system permease protein